MSFIIWYQVEIEESKPAGGLLGAVASLLGAGLPLKVSNDPFSGSVILDADITLTMKAGDSADTFQMTLINLPGNTADLIKKKQKEGLDQSPPQPLQMKIHLGYFDEPSTTTGSKPVMVGAITSIKNTVGDDGLLRTQISGQETGGYKLRTYCPEEGKPSQATAEDFVRAIAQKAGVEIDLGPELKVQLKDFTVKSENALAAIRQIAQMAQAPLVVRDNKIFIGASVGSEEAPVKFTQDDNIVRLDQIQENEEVPEPCEKRDKGQLKSKARTSVELTVLGHPGLRVGQTATVKAPDVPEGKLRINYLIHHFSTKSGYTCDIVLVVADPGKLAKSSTGAHGVVDRFRDVAEGVISQRPAVDVGQVTKYEPGNQQKHVATLNYDQSPDTSSVAPSVDTPVGETVQLNSKPLASSFAWHKCGLMVPVYPGMRALLAHNRGLVNDAVVAGFLWAENPTAERPQNEEGDYWLCLPTELGSDNQPTGKGVNDLIDKSGLRVIQAKGLQILVGADKLPDVGQRPQPPAEKTIVIEHQSGTKITIADDGAVRIETSSKDIALTNGSVTLKLSSSGVEVS
jgi:hypothetical protein